jgi:hypothetical protein
MAEHQLLLSVDEVRQIFQGQTVTRPLPRKNAKKPPMEPGDIAAIKEPYTETANGFDYRADKNEIVAAAIKWKNALTMPQEAVRLFLKVEEVAKADSEWVAKFSPCCVFFDKKKQVHRDPCPLPGSMPWCLTNGPYLTHSRKLGSPKEQICPLLQGKPRQKKRRAAKKPTLEEMAV